MSVDVVTFGCRLNAFESEVIAREAEGAGLTDTIVINSCAVTNEAVAQARQSIRRLKRERPSAKIVVTGCAAQTQPGMFADMAEVDRVVGNDEKMRSEAWRAACTALDVPSIFGIEACEKIAVADIMAVREMAPHLLEGFQKGLPRVFVQVQNGCDHRCTFCIIPYGRGNSRSVPMGAVVEQVRALVERGHTEIVLTGVDLTSYGADLPGSPKRRCGGCGRTSRSAPISSRGFRLRLKRCSRGRRIWCRNAASPSCTCFPIPRVRARRRHECRRSRAMRSRRARNACGQWARPRCNGGWRRREV
jgi:tRNA A37 methylthiotransferase MiaB